MIVLGIDGQNIGYVLQFVFGDAKDAFIIRIDESACQNRFQQGSPVVPNLVVLRVGASQVRRHNELGFEDVGVERWQLGITIAFTTTNSTRLPSLQRGQYPPPVVPDAVVGRIQPQAQSREGEGAVGMLVGAEARAQVIVRGDEVGRVGNGTDRRCLLLQSRFNVGKDRGEATGGEVERAHGCCYYGRQSRVLDRVGYVRLRYVHRNPETNTNNKGTGVLHIIDLTIGIPRSTCRDLSA